MHIHRAHGRSWCGQQGKMCDVQRSEAELFADAENVAAGKELWQVEQMCRNCLHAAHHVRTAYYTHIWRADGVT